jgi:hypothetical protein
VWGLSLVSHSWEAGQGLGWQEDNQERGFEPHFE